MSIRHRALLVPLVFVLVAGFGCATTHPDSKEVARAAHWPTIDTAGPIWVRAGEAPVGKFSIELPGGTLVIDLQEFTDAIVAHIVKALEWQSVAVNSEATTGFELEVVYSNVLTGGRYHCVIDYTVRAGNGYVRGLQARVASSVNPAKACKAAFSKAAAVCLADPQLRAYLEGAGKRATDTPSDAAEAVEPLAPL